MSNVELPFDEKDNALISRLLNAAATGHLRELDPAVSWDEPSAFTELTRDEQVHAAHLAERFTRAVEAATERTAAGSDLTPTVRQAVETIKGHYMASRMVGRPLNLVEIAAATLAVHLEGGDVEATS